MEAALPYLASPGSIKTALEKIRQAATPDRVTRDFVTTKLGIKGGTGFALIPYLKKIGLINADGTPSDLYKKFRNSTTGGAAIASAIKKGYGKLSEVNEYFYDLNDKDLQSLIVQVTGTEANSSVAKLVLMSFKAVKAFANFENPGTPLEEDPAQTAEKNNLLPTVPLRPKPPQPAEIGLNLSYTINLNLPASADQAVFNAIFRSLKEHLLSNAD
jgi:hypothetical protein